MHAEKVRRVEALMRDLDVTLHDLTLIGYVDTLMEPGSDVFAPTVGADEAFDDLRVDGFNLWDDARWAESAYEYEHDKVQDALRTAGALREVESA